MKIEIKGDYLNRKIFMDGKDVTDGCNVVEIGVMPGEVVKVILTYICTDVEINDKTFKNSITQKYANIKISDETLKKSIRAPLITQ